MYFGVVKLFFGVVKLPFVFLSVLLTLVILVYLLSLGGLALLVRSLGFFTCVKPCWAGFGGRPSLYSSLGVLWRCLN